VTDSTETPAVLRLVHLVREARHAGIAVEAVTPVSTTLASPRRFDFPGCRATRKHLSNEHAHALFCYPLLFSKHLRDRSVLFCVFHNHVYYHAIYIEAGLRSIGVYFLWGLVHYVYDDVPMAPFGIMLPLLYGRKISGPFSPTKIGIPPIT
jgi:hypothetical protein